MTQLIRKQINGILLLDKPAGITSNRALQTVKHLYNAKKAGHTGSLDPIATGMLPICFGEATKFSQYLLTSDKTYRVYAKLGVQTTTGDCEGEVIATRAVSSIERERLEQTMQGFLGDIEQVPPMYSAIKHQGKPLYELARRGIEIERKARRVTIFSMDLEHFENDMMVFTVHCSKGTYVRTLVEDIGNKLGCGGHVHGLRRLTINPYQNHQMYTLEMLTAIQGSTGHEGLINCLLPVESAIDLLPIVTLTSAAVFYLRMGQSVRTNLRLETSLVRLCSEDKRFLGIGELTEDGRVKPHRLIA